ncbi:hypothetical protein BJX63DRAFT_48525 [Aspergillus granulosus]|uniref:Uncharacterized protein n=1 Tax=Aspergillus granulosus TaxID=176169 RepID=A0ABR4HTX8_9EURO
MGVNHHVKSKYTFRLPLPLPFLKSKRMGGQERPIDDEVDTEDEVYTGVGPTVHVRYEPDAESESESDADIDPLDISRPAPEHRRLISWDGVKDRVRTRWTAEQERKLVSARAELARCQKAWSSEQEIWLKCIETLTEEKAAHEGFLNHRAKHIGDEQHHFRKACDRNRRRSEQDQPQTPPPRLTQAHRTGSLPVRLGRLRGRNSLN